VCERIRSAPETAFGNLQAEETSDFRVISAFRGFRVI
jgi:hypothetical protein